MLPDQSPIAFVAILVSLTAVGLIFAGRDLLTAARRRSAHACRRCGESYAPTWPTRSLRQIDSGPFVTVHVCPRCGEAWTPAGA